jgi:hypothetical protein
MKRNHLLSGVLLFLVLAIVVGGALVATRLLAGQESARPAAGGGRVMQSVRVGNDGVPLSVRTTILPAGELPDEAAAGSGVVLSRQDDVLTVGTGDIELSVEVSVDGSTGQEQTSVVPSASGPELEVVLTRDTRLYRDVTDIAGQLPDESGELTIVQEVRPVADGSQIAAQMEVQVWGERRGDRIVAEVVVFGPLAGGVFD